MKKVAILAYDGCWTMSMFSVTDFFRVVYLLDQHLGFDQSYGVEVLSADGGEVRVASGHVIQPDGAITDSGDYDLVVILAIEGARLSAGFAPDAGQVAWLKRQSRSGARLLTLTTGACFVAEAGLGEHRLLATHWAYVRPLKKRYPDCQFVAHQSCLQGADIWSTGSLNGGFDALLEILAQDRGDQFSQMCATHLLVSAPERLNPILPGHRNHCDEMILKAQDWIESHYAEAITISRIGLEVGLAERTLKRRFQTATRIPPNLYV